MYERSEKDGNYIILLFIFKIAQLTSFLRQKFEMFRPKILTSVT